MKTHSTKFRVEMEHIDGGDHANWLIQLAIAQSTLFTFRKQFGLGLEELKEERGFFFVMGSVNKVTYRRQLRYGDTIDVQMTMWICRPTCLQFRCVFYKNDEVATEMTWVMPLVSVKTEKLCKIPDWMIEIVGPEKPSSLRKVPASTTT